MFLKASEHDRQASQMLLLSFGKKQLCHPNILSNTLGLIHLGYSSLSSERLWGHCTTQRAFVHTQKS